MKRRSRNTEETFTLFPFLAVLLCTMGLLTLIFALVAQTTTSDEPELAAQDAAQNTEEPQAPQDAVLYFDETTALGSEPNGRIIDAETIAAAAGTRRSSGWAAAACSRGRPIFTAAHPAGYRRSSTGRSWILST